MKRIFSLIICIAMLIGLSVNISASHPFTDVKEDTWYSAAVEYCYSKNLVSGTSGTTFSPDMSLTRAMFVVILARAVDNTYLEYTNISFEDVTVGSWYLEAVEWAYQNKITSGTSSTTFSPDKEITREQVCVLFYNYLCSKGIEFDIEEGILDKYTDAGYISKWAIKGVEYAVSNGIISSTSTSKLSISPKMKMTRAQAVQMFMKFNENLPKKYFTISMDDGITQDLRIIDILKKYNVNCCTFMVNTGLYGANWEWVGQILGKPEITHLRFTEEELRSGIYDGFDVQCHTRTHPSLKAYDDNPDMIKEEVQKNADELYDITGIKPVGLAWPGGDNEYTEKTIELVLENTDIRYARGIQNSFNYKLPEYFMTWQPTCSVQDPLLLTYANNFIQADATEDMLFYVWGHGYEFDDRDLYDDFEKLIKMMSEAGDIILVSNTEFYELYKNEIPSWK
ncbi:MAG: S-layer homology domain-containing protein [Clostridia bacterium]|nr:S-layer homology domain-containing protein [Clostridia bacterium]